MKKKSDTESSDCLGGEPNDIARYIAKAAEVRVPLAVSFELTRRCSFRCVHCYLGDQESIRKHRQQEMDTTSIIKLIDEMASAGVLFLTVTGGDPMIHPDFLEIYRYAVRSGLLVTVFCNGSLITDEIVSTFIQYPPRAVEVTLYGASQATFEAVTQQLGSFAACMAGVERLRQGKVRLRLKTMVLTLNQADLPVLWQRAEAIDVQFRHDCSIIPALANGDNGSHSNAGDNLHDTLRFRLAPEQAAAADLSITQVREKLQERVCMAAPTETGQPSSKLYRCGAGRSSCHITPYGKMQPCLITLQPSFDITAGKEAFQAAWQSISRLIPEQEAGAGFSCNRCKDRSLCTGCPSNFSAETGNAEQAADFYCQYAASRREKSASHEAAVSS
ncbi:MAG: radical SAM additional 4Fe4S-binding SPASM domain-containing protein [Candidatus Electronema aureum]|uniref:Radical SAM additional 4Fe4S-binding SPASM domain-containing protein n=1 Tax=Candidatus Electronema aureum TaxID=2005002 RepID=A0A521FZD7_9BACT|nr:MAG: radical SAM additional 4Fe4S-binding SPASM domain-containing protein [Candidatus Electronema aureum]